MAGKIEDLDDRKPLILAPAGDRASFFAAIQAGADAIYCGLKQFSARMEATNFTMDELSRLVSLAHKKGVLVYITLNSLIKPDELDHATSMLKNLSTYVKPDAIIIQDLAFIKIAKHVGFKGEIHLSTLANLSNPAGLKTAFMLGVNRVVIPRELSIDEMKKMAAACPEHMDLEVFVQGALCYSVSGRCYWSSFFGGKSGLRGRCVQPCRRIYQQKGQKKSYFSCQDLSVDVLTKVVMTVPEIRTLKIEGRKKGPHYVYYTVRAYRMFRDEGNDPAAKKSAIAFLEQALGRGSTHYNFLPQRPQVPVLSDAQTGSGLFLGTVKGQAANSYLVPREKLLPNDLLRIGYEDESGHFIQRITISVPKKGRLHLKRKQGKIASNSPVFLIDRREKMLEELLFQIEKEFDQLAGVSIPESTKPVKVKLAGKPGLKSIKNWVYGDMCVTRDGRTGKKNDISGIWMKAARDNTMPAKSLSSVWWWLPPVLWPDDEDVFSKNIFHMIEKGATRFVLNAPWQMAFFKEFSSGQLKKMVLWAGPFCNISNGLAMAVLADMGFSGVIVSPELSKSDYSELSNQSCLPLGIVVEGNWPLGISRTLSNEISTDRLFKSPKGEEAWVSKIGSDNWVFPNWKIDLTSKKNELQKAGFSLFVNLQERVPRDIQLKPRPGLWNWEHGLS